ncbi:MAG: ABC transporter permease subunit [Streptosporangiales bacterium]|nr:ABC transporter permease subunit [Streptosporangiales bacterium]
MLSGIATFRRNRLIGLSAAVVLCLLVVAAASASLWVPHDPTAMAPADRLSGPSGEYWFGTDNFGRDIFSRVVFGGRVSLIVGLSVAALATVFGAVAGLLAGYFRRVDDVLMRVVDGLMAFPSIILALALVAALGGSLTNVIIALAATTWPIMTRVVRSSTLQLRELQFVEAAVATGTNKVDILVRHILPNALTPIIVQATFIFAEAVLAEAALSFLGLGIKPPTPTWGNILGESRSYLTIAPWYSIFPGFAIVLTVLSLNIFGDMLRDIMDPHSGRR